MLHLVQTYFLPKCPPVVQSRAAFLLAELSSHHGLSKLKLDAELRLTLQDLTIDLFVNSRTTMNLYGVQLAAELCNQTNMSDQLYVHLIKAMTHNRFLDVRRACVQQMRAPFSQMSLVMLGKRLRDKDDEVRRQAFIKLTRCKVTLEAFPSLEQRMLIVKEGLTDPSPAVREACSEFLKPSMVTAEGKLAEDLSYLFKIIDCKLIFVKEYYVQLPFIIMRFLFELAGEDDLQISTYLERTLALLRAKAGLLPSDDLEPAPLSFEELLLLRVAFEFTRIYKGSEAFTDHMEKFAPSFEDYRAIFECLIAEEDRLLLAEWVKFSLQLAVEDEVTRRNLVSLMFAFIGQVEHSFADYVALLKPGRYLIRDCEPRSLEQALEMPPDEEEEFIGDSDVIEIEIREFRDLALKRPVPEYCKPFAFESLALDCDDACRLAVIVARRLLDARIDEFSLCMLQAIADVREPLEEDQEDFITFKRQREIVYRKMEAKLEQVNELVAGEDYSVGALNGLMRKVRHYVALIEELNLKEKLCFKRALNLCLILLKQCRADVNDQNLVSICETLIGPTIQSKDKDNMLLAVECIGLLCLLDKELFHNYARIFETILSEGEDNLREKVIALKSSVDALIIHGGEARSTQKLQRLLLEDYLVSRDPTLRQVAIEGVCKMLFSRKLTHDHAEIEFLLA